MKLNRVLSLFAAGIFFLCSCSPKQENIENKSKSQVSGNCQDVASSLETEVLEKAKRVILTNFIEDAINEEIVTQSGFGG